MFRLAYRNFGDHESLVVNHTVAGGALAGVRWYEIRNPGGAPIVYDTITSTVSLNQALRMTRGSGSVVILGLAAMPEGVDWTPIWLNCTTFLPRH